MKIKNLTEDSTIYTSNVFLITGTWNALSDVNTLIDVGRDVSILEKINNYSTGVGKQKVEQVFLTHGHYDHAGIISTVKREFDAKVYAYSQSVEGVDYLVRDGEKFKVGDSIFEIIYSPGHSSDSICLYCEEKKVLFAGDTPLIIKTVQGSYEFRFIKVLERLLEKEIEVIYFGHGSPYVGNCREMLTRSLELCQMGN